MTKKRLSTESLSNIYKILFFKKVSNYRVGTENKSKPLTDDELVDVMTQRGYKVARRTIAKYRDQLGIPKARLRKEL